MKKTVIAGVAALLLSAGVAVAQSNSDQNSMSAGTSASSGASAGMQSDSASDAATAPAKKAQRVASYPKAEAKLNREEALQTKQLNMQESQEVASNSSGMGGSMSNAESSSQPQ
jgi:uncharacterized protein involved in copper resistance